MYVVWWCRWFCVFRLKAMIAEEEQKRAFTAKAQSREEVKTLLSKLHSSVSSAPATASPS